MHLQRPCIGYLFVSKTVRYKAYLLYEGHMLPVQSSCCGVVNMTPPKKSASVAILREKVHFRCQRLSQLCGFVQIHEQIDVQDKQLMRYVSLGDI